jgi:hypothetical protein
VQNDSLQEVLVGKSNLLRAARDFALRAQVTASELPESENPNTIG